MKKRIFTFLTLLVAFFGLIGLTTNNYKVINAAGNQTTVNNDLNAITVPSTALISFPVTYKSVYGNTIEWTVQEGKENIIQYDEEAHWMVVNRPTEGDDEKVDITVTVTGANNATATKTFKVTVPVGKTVTKEYQISYELDGGTNHQDNPSSYHLGDATITLQAPTKEGYTFLGWYEGETKIEKIYVGSMQDYELTAQWTIKQYTITFNTAGGTEIVPITQDYGTAVTAPSAPTKEGYTFAGWDKEIPTTMPADDVTITAQWTINQYTITFNTADGTEIAPITQDYGTAVTAPSDPTKEGYTFAGWDEEIPSTMPAGNVTITAKWTINQYTITFNTAGGIEIAPITQNYGTAVTAPSDPTREGYTFAGWDEEIPSTMPAGNVTITAKWTVNQYTVTFIVDNKTVKTGKYDFDSLIDFPDEPTKEGATFTGWFLEEEKYEEGKKVPSKDITLVAGWDNKTQFTITFVTGEDATVIAPITVYEGVAVENPGTPTKEGYDFAGWENEQSEVVEFPYTPTKDITLTAQWNIKQYKVIFKDWNGTTLKEEQTVNHGSAAIAPADPTREGYKFTDWDADFTSVTSNLTITAQYEILTYKVIFKDWNGTTLKEEQTVNHGSAATAPVDPTREGYKFTGWDINFTSVTSDLTITAQYEILTYKVIFKDWDGTVLKEEQTVNHGSAAIAPDDPTREEFTFAGWDKSFESVTSDLTITALYTPNNMAEYIASEMEKVIAEELTETNLETELKEAIALVQGYDGGSVFFTSENAAISIDAEGNVTLIAPTNPTTVTLTAIVSHEGETTTATYRYFTVQLTGVAYGNITDQTNDVTIENVPTNAELTVEEVPSGNIQVEVEGQELAVAYDITLVSGANNLNGEFTVRIPVPQEYVDVETFYVYHVDGTNKTEITPVTIITENEIKYVQFSTTHFSVYALYVDEKPEIVAEELNEYYYEFTETIISLSDENVMLNDIEWNSINDGNDYAYDSAKGQKIGSGNHPAECWTLTTVNYFTNITKIIVHASGASSIKGSISVKIGDNEGVCDSASLTSSNTEYVFTFEGTEVGQITISMTQTSSKAFYMKSIAVNPAYATVTYQANNGTDYEITSEVMKGSTITIPECEFTFDKHKFSNWKYSEEKVYSAGESLLVNEDITLIAQWSELVSITYSIDEQGTDTKTYEVIKGNKFNLISNPFTLEGQKFTNWDINGATYEEEAELTAEEDLFIVACWEESDTPQLVDKTYSYTFSTSQYSANGTKSLNGVEWTLEGDGGYWGYDNQNDKGQQFGSGSKPYKTLTFTSANFNNVSKIIINTSGASSVNASFTVTVGGVKVGESTKLTASATSYTFKNDTPLTGAIVFTFTQTSSKAIYIKSITVEYAE